MRVRLSKSSWTQPLLLLGDIILLLVFGALLLPYALPNPCGNDEAVETVSPSGKLKAVCFRRSCGVTTGYSTHISILPSANHLPNDYGNTFITDNELLIDVRWIDDQRLRISCAGVATAIRHKTSVGGVEVIYE